MKLSISLDQVKNETFFQTFRHCLIKKLQQEFENRYQKAYTSDENEVTATEQEFRDGKSKHHVLGNIKFIGKL